MIEKDRSGFSKMPYSAKRKAAIEKLGGKCQRCGFRDRRALQIDHYYGDGAAERREYGPRVNEIIYEKIMNGDTWSYQLLCANCNWIKRAEKNEARSSSSNYSRMKNQAKKRGFLAEPSAPEMPEIESSRVRPSQFSRCTPATVSQGDHVNETDAFVLIQDSVGGPGLNHK